MGRAVRNAFSDVDDTIKGFEDVFAGLRKEFEGDAVIETEISVLRIWNALESRGERPVFCTYIMF